MLRLFVTHVMLISLANAPEETALRVSDHIEVREMVVTAYCPCALCTGSAHVNRTANGSRPEEPEPGVFSLRDAAHLDSLATRLLLLEPTLLPNGGTISADLDCYPFGTQMFIPGYGWGTVEDTGGGVHGRSHIDVYMPRHRSAVRWGRRHVAVAIVRPD